MDITPEQLAEWERLAEQATPVRGWAIIERVDDGEYNIYGANDEWIGSFVREVDALLFAAARSAVPALCAAVREQQEAMKKARQQLRATQENWHEDCLFECDAILTEAIGDVTTRPGDDEV